METKEPAKIYGVMAEFDPRATGRGAASPRLWHVPASSIRPGSPSRVRPSLSLIALVEYRPGSATEAAPMYFNYRKTSIYGGSNEIQRNIIAKAILGL
mgnify:CR=1 FL=1